MLQPLQFYSTKAYCYVRKSVSLSLPHPSTVRRWYRNAHADAGFTNSSFDALSTRVEEASEQGHRVICSLVMDEMSIRRHVEWDGTRFVGYVDIGTGVTDDSTPVAKDVFVLLVVAFNDNWKIPCGYFFIDGMSGEERSNIVNECITRLHETGVLVVSITCDVPSFNMAMICALDCIFDPFSPNFRPSFQHPCQTHDQIQIMLDPCHMLKLIRNCLGDLAVLHDNTNTPIQWAILLPFTIYNKMKVFV